MGREADSCTAGFQEDIDQGVLHPARMFCGYGSYLGTMAYAMCTSQEIVVEQGSVFKSKQGQAVRLPKAAAFPEDVTRVDIVTIGRARLLAPAGKSWDAWFSDETASKDFLTSRDQPPNQTRDCM